MPLPVFRRRSYLPLLLEWVVRLILAPLYRVKAIGTAHVPGRGGVLLIANHLSYVDIIALQIACPRPIRFIGYKGLRRSAFSTGVLRSARRSASVTRIRWRESAPQ
jgi:acyl-[acyl-carrier-protein]-phospholipid O-acyltransferase/long-chain-fatty-acid--[acyl-carrier-protein] ligase